MFFVDLYNWQSAVIVYPASMVALLRLSYGVRKPIFSITIKSSYAGLFKISYNHICIDLITP